VNLIEARPRFSFGEVEKVAEEFFGTKCQVKPLPGYIDQNFYVENDRAEKFVLKISHRADSRAAVEAQIAMVSTLTEKMPEYCFPTIVASKQNDTIFTVKNSNGDEHLARMVRFISGNFLSELKETTDEMLFNLGLFLGKVDRNLMDFDHCGLHRGLDWDLKNVLDSRRSLAYIPEPGKRRLVEYFLLQFETHVFPELSRLRRSAIHNDANDFNVLVDEVQPEKIKGLIDFGDVVFSNTIFELAIGCTYSMFHKSDPLQAATQVIQGYHQEFPLEKLELELLYFLIAGRLCQSVIIAAESRVLEPENKYIGVSEKDAWKLLDYLLSCNPERAKRRFLRSCGYQWQAQGMSKNEILKRREKLIGKSLSISYKEPLKIIGGALHYLYDESGKTYLDAVNNVPHVGHSHPHIVKTAQRQMAILNTNTRYLYDYLIEYAERLTAKFPDPLSVCFFVNSGSEANDLALRLAKNFTGQKDMICIDAAYHGTTAADIEISPYKFDGPGGAGLAAHIHKVEVPDVFRGRYRRDDPNAAKKYARQVYEKIEELKKSGKSIAAFISESLMGVAGQIVFPDGYLRHVYRYVRDVGGLCIADEVQIGFGRVGTHFWGFETQNVVPDIVTLGKPIGNGHPLAAVVTTPEIADAFANGMEYFNTYGGNPVSCAVGLAVLDVIEQEGLQENARVVGEYLKNRLQELKQKFPLIGDVRGLGLFLGVELVRSRETLEPAVEEATETVERMKNRGILLSTDGPFYNVIKIKPPIIFTKKHVDFLAGNLEKVMGEMA